MEAHLRRPYIAVPLADRFSYGGSQMWFPQKMISRCACGPIAAFDLLNYVSEDFGSRQLLFLSREEYIQCFLVFQQRYFPFLYPNGINGFGLALGVNRAFRQNGIPLTAYWAASEAKILPRLLQMLNHNIPVILSVGPHFPAFWKKTGVSLYRRKPDGTMIKSSRALSHYVTVTDLCGDWMTISSWGKKYEISIPEYLEYMKKSSTPLFSSILYVKSRRG